jgi:hypothetical protein
VADGDLLLVVSGSGTIAPEAVRALADLVQLRAERALSSSPNSSAYASATGAMSRLAPARRAAAARARRFDPRRAP